MLPSSRIVLGEPELDVDRFFFFYKNVVAKCANESETATQILPCLTGKGFDS